MARKMKANQKQVKKQKPMTQLQALNIALKELRESSRDEAFGALTHIRKLRDTLKRKQENQAQYYRTRPRKTKADEEYHQQAAVMDEMVEESPLDSEDVADNEVA